VSELLWPIIPPPFLPWLQSVNLSVALMKGPSLIYFPIRTITHPPTPTCRLYFTTFPHPPPKQETLNDPGFQLEQIDVRGIRTPPSDSSEPTKHYYFTIDDQLMYMSFFQDWGPLNVAMVYKACIYIHSLLIVSRISILRRETIPYSTSRVQSRETSSGLHHTHPPPKPAKTSSCLLVYRSLLPVQVYRCSCLLSG
jgi:Dual specificity protein phosphatase, N-terminal half